jgi:hypothetical protein
VNYDHQQIAAREKHPHKADCFSEVPTQIKESPLAPTKGETPTDWGAQSELESFVFLHSIARPTN